MYDDIMGLLILTFMHFVSITTIFLIQPSQDYSVQCIECIGNFEWPFSMALILDLSFACF